MVFTLLNVNLCCHWKLSIRIEVGTSPKGLCGPGDHQLELPARVLIASWRPSGTHSTSSFQEFLDFLNSPILINR